MTPSPAARVLRPDPKAWGQRYTAEQRAAHREAVRAHAITAGHPSIYDRDQERPEMSLLVATSLSVVLGMAQTVAALAAKYGGTLPADEWARIADLSTAADDARRVVAAWADGTSVDDTPPHGIGRPGA